MRTKKSKPEENAEAPATSTVFPAPETGEDTTRLSFAVDSEGRIVWDGMRPKTRDRLKAILGAPEVAKALGVEPAVQPVEVFDPAWTGALYDSLGKMEAFLAGKIYHIPADIAAQAFSYSAAEKETLAGPTAKVINKYAATWMVTFKDEIALAFLFVSITAVKLQMATVLMKMREAPAPVRAVPSQPIRREPSSADLDATELERAVSAATKSTDA